MEIDGASAPNLLGMDDEWMSGDVQTCKHAIM